MSLPKHIPANAIRASNIVYDGAASLFGGNVQKGDPMYQVLCVISKLIDELFKNDLLECIDLKKLGIQCPDKDIPRQCLIMNWIVDNININNQTLAQLVTNIQILQTSIGVLKDEKVKVRAAGMPGYLEDIIVAPPSTIQYDDNKVTFLGFVPVGFRATISKSRLGDFDATGKGKPDTDLWGWAINNGNNGLINLLGQFRMSTDVLANADTIGGQSSFTISKDNISSFTMGVTGLIGDALENNVRFRVGYKHYRSFDGKDGPDSPIKHVPAYSGDSEWFTVAANFKHSHSFNLSVSHNNPNPAPISLVPNHIKEIPIERIIP